MMALDLGIPPLQLQQAKLLCQLHFKYTYGYPTTGSAEGGSAQIRSFKKLRFLMNPKKKYDFP